MEARFFGCFCYTERRKKNHYRLILLIAKFWIMKKRFLNKKQTEKSELEREKRTNATTAKPLLLLLLLLLLLMVDDEKRQNKRRLSTGIERIFFLKHTSVAKIDRCCCFFFPSFSSDCNTMDGLCVWFRCTQEREWKTFWNIMVIWAFWTTSQQLKMRVCCLL